MKTETLNSGNSDGFGRMAPTPCYSPCISVSLHAAPEFRLLPSGPSRVFVGDSCACAGTRLRGRQAPPAGACQCSWSCHYECQAAVHLTGPDSAARQTSAVLLGSHDSTWPRFALCVHPLMASPSSPSQILACPLCCHRVAVQDAIYSLTLLVLFTSGVAAYTFKQPDRNIHQLFPFFHFSFSFFFF